MTTIGGDMQVMMATAEHTIDEQMEALMRVGEVRARPRDVAEWRQAIRRACRVENLNVRTYTASGLAGAILPEGPATFAARYRPAVIEGATPRSECCDARVCPTGEGLVAQCQRCTAIVCLHCGELEDEEALL